MRQWSLLLTGIFVSASIVVPTQVKAQKKPVQVQKLPPMNPTLFGKLGEAASTAVYNCYTNKLVHECLRFNRIQNILMQYCATGNKWTCRLSDQLTRRESNLQSWQDNLGPNPHRWTNFEL